MSMYINTNVGAINAHRNLGMNNTAMGKTMEKLSSGFRINRAADDAAGLAISEKMRFQINGLNQATRNAQDGISLLQTAEGALTEVHSMLQRMNTLANQASNGTYQDADRDKLQAEVNQLVSEINNITNSTKFNGVDLLKTGEDGAKIKFQVGVNAENVIDINLKDMSADSLKLTEPNKILEAHGLKFKDGGFTDLEGKKVTVTNAAGDAITDIKDAIGQTIKVTTEGKPGAAAFAPDFDVSGAASDDFAGVLAKLTGLAVNANDDGYEKGGKAVGILQDDGTVKTDKASIEAALADKATAAATLAAGKLVSVESETKDVNVKSELTITDLNIKSEDGARAAIAVIENAINMVSSQRSEFGAVQNRLEHTINNLGVNAENLSASESRIRNADMAKEMTEFTRNQILVQAGTAMLAQANSAPQSVLKLLG